MNKKINLPFTNMKGSNNNSFKILNENKLNKLSFKKSAGLINSITNIIYKNSNSNSNSNKSNSINYIKASTTQEYYKNINK